MKRVCAPVPLIVLLVIPGACWAFYKPVRVLAPELNGFTCFTDTICTEEMARYEEASVLYVEAFAFVNAVVGAIEDPPRAVFCSTRDCFESFGFDQAAAHTVRVSGIVMSPQGWKSHHMRHEMIHHLQAERLGVFERWRGPVWSRREWLMRWARMPDPFCPSPGKGTVHSLRHG